MQTIIAPVVCNKRVPKKKKFVFVEHYSILITLCNELFVNFEALKLHGHSTSAYRNYDTNQHKISR